MQSASDRHGLDTNGNPTSIEIAEKTAVAAAAVGQAASTAGQIAATPGQIATAKLSELKQRRRRLMLISR